MARRSAKSCRFTSASRLIAPDRPTWPRRAAEQFDLADLGIKSLDHFSENRRLCAMLSARRLDHRRGLLSGTRRRHFAALRDQQQFVLIACMVSHADLVFDPDDVRPIF